MADDTITERATFDREYGSRLGNIRRVHRKYYDIQMCNTLLCPTSRAHARFS